MEDYIYVADLREKVDYDLELCGTGIYHEELICTWI